jgi:hypothetical protein
MRYMTIIACVCILMGVVACKPRSIMMADNPDGPPEYQQAWKDGCESGMSTYGNSFYKTFYSYKMDPNLRDNELYYRTWKDAFNYCRHFTKSNLAQGFAMDSLFTGTGYGIKEDEPFNDLRTPRAATQEGFTLPGWGGMKLLGE